MPHEMAEKNMRLFAAKVMPELKRLRPIATSREAGLEASAS